MAFSKKLNPGVLKYFAALALQLCVVLLSLDVNLQLSVTTMITPIVALAYFSPAFTLYTCILSSISQILISCITAKQAVEYFWPNITPLDYVFTTGGGHLMESIIVTIVFLCVTITARKLMLFLQKRNQQVQTIQNQLVYSFADMIESRDGTTGEHVKRSSQTVALITEYLIKNNIYGDALSLEELQLIALVAPLHDIGKMKVPDSILSKPGKLTSSEFDIIKTHPTEGVKIIDRTMKNIEDERYLKIARNMALYHHEKWDGTGYPKGLHQTEIPISARIMAVADVFDALCSKRSYKEQFSIDEAYEILKDSSGKHFEPCLVEIMIKLRPKLQQIYIF